jgi:ATP-dependent Lhr-like helicase
MASAGSPRDLAPFHPAVAEWFARSFPTPTAPQALGWPVIARGDSALVLAPTGTGKTLTAFLWCINRLMFAPVPSPAQRCRVVYVSPLKALAVDVERNLRAPIAGISRLAADRGEAFHVPAVAVRTGDTPADERRRFLREPTDILITTPESLYLLLTSRAREVLRAVDTIILDEIHALVPTKRGAHLALSVERLERVAGRRLQRIGLSATQRPLDEVARFLGGAVSAAPAVTFRPVTIVDAGAKKALDLRLEVPVEDMARLDQPVELPSGPAAQGPVRPSIWTAIHPRLIELIRAHRSTLLFVNSRRVAERLAAALNELAGDTLVRAHHGSLARAQRVEVEDALKAGALRALVATSSLELGIDMGAIDLVVQIEAPPSVASGLQRIGRAGHQVDAASRGVIFPKYRGDLVACAAAARAMHDGEVEATRYQRNPLDVLAQQIVAMVGMDPWVVDDLYAAVRSAAPFAELPRTTFEGVLDMLSGRYPSDDFAELRPRLTWDRVSSVLTARDSTRRVAIVNGGTIPDRGLYGVFLADGRKGTTRVGELDEEMVFESRVGETFVLGASTWRIEEITHDRVIVAPAPGEPGKMPFWKGEAATRPIEFGRAIGALVRTLDELPPTAARERLVREHDLDPQAAENLLAYLGEQKAAVGALPDDRTIVVERCRDELGDWRMCVMSPFGGQVLAPWSLAAVARVREESGLDVEAMWTNDGFILRFPETDDPPDLSLILPPAEDAERLVIGQLGASALFAARFRECAGRALLLPRRRPGQRSPLWQQRKKASDLLAVASRFPSFPLVLEAHRECLRDLFDMPAFHALLDEVRAGRVRIVTKDTQTPSPFAASLLFGYVANYLYDGDAPLAERRAQALSIDQEQLRELLGDAELRELLDADVMADVERQLQHLDADYRARSVDGVHDLLLRVGDLSRDEIAARSAEAQGATWAEALLIARRAVELPVGGATRLVAIEDVVRYRDGLGIPLPPGIPESLLAGVQDPLGDLVMRFARTHAPFAAADVAQRFALGRTSVEQVLHRLTVERRLLEGAFRPGGTAREWCAPDVLSTIRRHSRARLRKEIEPVEPHVLARFVAAWQGTTRPRKGLDAMLDAVEHLQGAPLVASLLETDILPARVADFEPADLDTLLAAGEVVWVGLESLGERDGRIALFLTDHMAKLCRPGAKGADATEREQVILEHLTQTGASFFAPIHEACGGGFPGDTLDALWALVWRGLVTNDAFQALRHRVRPPARDRRAAAHAAGRVFRSRRAVPPSGEGRWSIVAVEGTTPTSDTAWSAAMAQQLLTRYGVVTREVAHAEALGGGFSAVYEVLRSMEERGRIRRGYFASGVGAMQFAMPAALDLLRALRVDPEDPEVVRLSAVDPANAYGALLKWTPGAAEIAGPGRGPTRSAGAQVIIVSGRLGAWLSRTRTALLTFLPGEEPERSLVASGVASALADIARDGQGRQGGLLVAEIDGQPAASHALAPFLEQAGFTPSALGYHVRRDSSGRKH